MRRRLRGVGWASVPSYGRHLPDYAAGWVRGSGRGYSSHTDFHAALAAVDGALGADGASFELLGVTAQDALRSEQGKAQKTLSRAVLAQKCVAWRSSLGATSRERAIMAMSSAEGRRSLASEWLVTTPYSERTTLYDAHYLTALRKRLGLPVAVRGDRCRVLRAAGGERAWEARGRMRGRECGALLLPDADHAQSCAVRARVRRHDAVADLCAAIHAEAGKEPIRADVLVRVPPPGTWECAEIKIRHFFRGDGTFTLPDAAHVDAALSTVEADARAKYAPVAVHPWVISSMGRPGEAMCADLRRLARRRLALPDAKRAVSPLSVLSLLMQRWRAELSCALVATDAAVYLDALREGPQVVDARALGRAEVQVYDLVSYRGRGPRQPTPQGAPAPCRLAAWMRPCFFLRGSLHPPQLSPPPPLRGPGH
eukprot:gene25584-biopygen15047